MMQTYSYELPMTPELAALFGGSAGVPQRSSLPGLCGMTSRKVSSARTRFLATKDAAEYLGVSVWTLRSYVHDGRLEYIPGGKWRFDREDLDRFLVESKEREQAL